MTIDHEPIEIEANIQKNDNPTIGAYNVDCLQHARCHCSCHVNKNMKHCVPCCYECPYCHQNVIYTGKVLDTDHPHKWCI